MQLTTKSSAETQGFGKNFARGLKGGEILALTGELGSGKTTFVQGLARGLGIKQRINSPTFILMRQYPVSFERGPLLKLKFFYHIDLYRLEGDLTQEINNLGLNDVWGKPENIVAIEWAEKIKEIIPKTAVWIKFKITPDEQRKIIIEK